MTHKKKDPTHKHLPILLSPPHLLDRHSKLLSPIAPSADNRGYSEFLQVRREVQAPLPGISREVPSASTFVREEVIAVHAKRFEKRREGDGVTIDYRKAMEPRVALPFLTSLAQTPRKIAMERKKRMYASVDIKSLIEVKVEELREKGLVETGVEGLLPLHVFDDTTYDPRTVDDWLDMGNTVHNIALSRLRIAKIPIPAKAFDGLEWRDCLAIAYDVTKALWKVKWRAYDCWTLDKMLEEDEVYVHPEDENLVEEVGRGDIRECIEGKEMWRERY